MFGGTGALSFVMQGHLYRRALCKTENCCFYGRYIQNPEKQAEILDRIVKVHNQYCHYSNGMRNRDTKAANQ
jgi:hypothetical protein